jgi:DNA-binding winged helix-turn-helix (wHTH) protein
MQPKRIYVFGPFRVDVAERVLSGEKGVVPLTPKAFDTLLVLIENSGHVLSKEELMEKVWPDSFVEENNLAQNISALRKALGGEGGGQKVIETVPKRGYRFIADVKEAHAGEAELIIRERTRTRIVIEEETGEADSERVAPHELQRMSGVIDLTPGAISQKHASAHE